MPSAGTFGRRAAPISVSPPALRLVKPKPAVERHEPAPMSTPVPGSEAGAAEMPARGPLSVEQEVQQWNEARKTRKRSFREPWRSVSIVAGLGFVATSWILPDTVANVAQLALGVLTVGSFYAGWRAKKTG